MRQVNVHGLDDVRLDLAPPPNPGRKDVLIRIAACGICGTDISCIRRGSRRADGPLPLGHEAAGFICEAGPDVDGFRVGQRVIVNPMGGGGPADTVIGCGGSEGALTETLLVRDPKPNRSLFEIPANVPYDIAALAEPLGVAMHAVNRAAPKAGEQAMVCGAGPIGLGAILWLKRAGVRNIVASDLSEERLDLARQVGASATVLAGRDDLRAALTAAHGEARTMIGTATGTDIFIDAAGAGSFVEAVVGLAKTHARLVCVGVHHKPVTINLGAMLMSEMTITTSMGYPTELPDVLAALAEMDPKALAPLISHRFAFDDALQAFEAAGKQAAAKVMIEFPLD